MSTIFHKILNKEIPSTCIYEDEFVYVFLDINPKSKGHSLVIPKKFHLNIEDMNEKQLQGFFTGMKKALLKLKETYNFSQYNILQNNGPLAGQEVNYLHFHLIPVYE